MHEDQVEPAPEFESHFVKMTDDGKSKAAVQADRHLIVRVDTGNHHVLTHVGGAAQEFDHQGPPDTLSSAVRANVDAVLDTVPVTRP